MPGGGPELIEFPMTFDAALGAGVEGEFREETRVCRLDLRRGWASKAKYHGYGH
jgi:hypothetical protein